MRITGKEVTDALKKQGYKLTPQRRAVIQAIVSSQDHLTPAVIYEKVNRGFSHISLVTIYRTLDILAELGLICELHAGGVSRSYTIGTKQHHHHLICSNCGIVVDFTTHNLSRLETRLANSNGFRIDGHVLEFFGMCPDCRTAT